MKRRDFLLTTSAFGLSAMRLSTVNADSQRPNILLIVAEDASPHLGCYGETSIQTPHLDALAREGVRFENAFVTCPVCSPCRTALVTGMYQTTIGGHNHRSQGTEDKRGGNRDYYGSYALPKDIPFIRYLFKQAGYYVCNGGGPSSDTPGKTDYNFMVDGNDYDGADWLDAPKDTPFFAQVQLSGGKSRPRNYEANPFTLPPYYPDDSVIRKDWAEYLGCWEKMDAEVGLVIQRLKDAGQFEHTIIVVLTDHGISHARGKQFLYEEGIRIPMIIRFPDRHFAGTVRHDLVLQIDLLPTALAWAGIPIPNHLQGRDLFADSFEERAHIVSARDRCDETLDTIRCLRTPRFKYIRNFQSFRSHMQHNQYKDGKDIVQRLRELHGAGQLSPLQDRIFAPTRPVEELYDLSNDPYEIENLAGLPEYQPVVADLRSQLYAWMVETGDPGLFPEPILEDLGLEYGNKYAAMQQVGREQIPLLLETMEAGEKKNTGVLVDALQSPHPAQRYWAATWLGIAGGSEAASALESACGDANATVRIAAHLALCRLGAAERHLPELASLLDDKNQIVGMYVMDAIDQTSILDDTVEKAAQKALYSAYDGTQRYGKRLIARFAAKNGN